MTQSYRTMVGTVGTGIWISDDGGERWTRCRGMWNETQVFALASHPQDPKVVFAGAHDGIYRSDDGGVHLRVHRLAAQRQGHLVGGV